MKRLVSLLVFISLTSFTYTYAGGTGQGAAVHTLVIDPGHGGMDPGAIGPGGHHEADLALAVSLKFGEMVKQAFPDVKIIYTRTTDKFVSLADRADMANKAKADLFVCIHLNSATTHDAYGTATYVLGLHRTDDNLEVAKRENAVIELEGDKDKNYEFDPNSPEGHIIMSMKQNAFLDQSILIASKIEDELAVLSKRKSRGVKQAGFWVLYKTAMPSLLAEIGFISNPTEEQYLATDDGQTNIATSIFKAFRSYKFEIEGKKDTTVAQPKKADIAPAVVQPVAQNTNQSPKADVKIYKPDTLLMVASADKKTDTIKAQAKHNSKIASVSTSIPDTSHIVQHGKVIITPEPTQPKTEKTSVPPKKDDNTASVVKNEPQVKNTNDLSAKADKTVTPAKENTSSTIKKEETHAPRSNISTAKTDTVISFPSAVAPSPPKPQSVKTVEKPEAPVQKTTLAKSEESVYFTVQLMAAKHKPANYNDLVNSFGLVNTEEVSDGLMRYLAGEYLTYSEAKKALELAHTKGIKDAFIVGYLNKKRVDGKTTYQLGLKYP